MRLLLDTHALLWWVQDDPQLSSKARDTIASFRNEIYVSAASAWEIATKVRIGKLPGAEAFAGSFAERLHQLSFRELPITVQHAQRAGLLPGTHKDPFGRMLIAQALTEDLPIVSNEILFDHYMIKRIW
ncbi:MAG: type II toxin-antitoxin system VapC family toxin [Acidobacteria bacterium]|nr:type II toxin-antitoxin system VapC family toxin [Acidobacteriota bacterium]